MTWHGTRTLTRAEPWSLPMKHLCGAVAFLVLAAASVSIAVQLWSSAHRSPPTYTTEDPNAPAVLIPACSDSRLSLLVNALQSAGTRVVCDSSQSWNISWWIEYGIGDPRAKGKLTASQRANHIPGLHLLTRKDVLPNTARGFGISNIPQTFVSHSEFVSRRVAGKNYLVKNAKGHRGIRLMGAHEKSSKLQFGQSLIQELLEGGPKATLCL